MKLRPTFSHTFLLLSSFFLLAACGGPEAPEQRTIPVPTPAEEKGSTDIPSEIKTLLATNTCLGCHRLDKKLIGPSYTDIAGKEYGVEELVRLMQEPQPENWPDYPPMASMSFVAVEDLTTIAEWIVQLGEE